MNRPDTPTTLGDLLRRRAAGLALIDEQGGADPERLAHYLTSRGIRCTPRSIDSYFRGERAPRIGKMELILDALDVHGDDRLLAYRLAARTDLDPVESHVSPSADGLVPTS
jgi:hypothetical protein